MTMDARWDKSPARKRNGETSMICVSEGVNSACICEIVAYLIAEKDSWWVLVWITPDDVAL